MLNDVSANDLASKQVRDTAKVVLNDAQKLKRELQYEEKKGGRSHYKEKAPPRELVRVNLS